MHGVKYGDKLKELKDEFNDTEHVVEKHKKLEAYQN